ncbi:MAG: OFA family MFS transporter [Ruminococcaceae bacterium]|nr:OFA family MFS transporter [Oscillospiraceae bacterium]
MSKNTKSSNRWLILTASVFAMLFAGIIYAWSILKVPFAQDFGWNAEQLSLNFTLTMCSFCLGGLLGSFLARKIGVKLTGLISAVLAGIGMVTTGFLNSDSVVLLYLTYAVMAGLGIGIAYNVIIATVSAHFPDKKGLCTGCLMMGFGASSLILGNLADLSFKSEFGLKGTYILLGIALFAVLGLVSLFLRRPIENEVLPVVVKKKNGFAEDFEQKDYTTKQMLKRFSFWRAFALLAFATAVGNSVISFARDLAVSVGAKVTLATTLVGVLAVFNGFGRIITGALFDWLGRKKTMLIATVLTIVAAGITLLSVITGSVVLCIIGLCLTGLSYGSCPTMVTSFVSSFYGQKHFATNFSIMNCNLICASFIATVCSNLLKTFGGYTAPFILLLTLAVVALILNLSIKRP